jgi:SAM-dependent methyltransferase
LDIISEIFNDEIRFAVLSDVKKGIERHYKKIQVKPFLKNGAILYQFTFVYDKKVIHKNMDLDTAIMRVSVLLQDYFNQCVAYGKTNDYHILSFGAMKVKKSAPTKASELVLNHDIKKDYILAMDGGYEFLIRLGVMSKDGKVLKEKYDKFRQINKYLELIAECTDALTKADKIRIVDFGCGKAYLTFALYYYLVDMLHRDVEIIGLDLKEDVISFCNTVAQDLHYDDLSFEKGDIKGFVNSDKVNMVITLHACDTATDDAIVQAIKWCSDVILTVPCCQHELFSKIQNNNLNLMTKHGIIKERLSSLITDSIRGQLLEASGYTVNIMEFISFEHTPKNILIKAVKSGGFNAKAYDEYKMFAEFWGVMPYLESQLLNVKCKI